ncbi:MAG: metallophosphoesterase [Bryobacteraceae bacterium]
MKLFVFSDIHNDLQALEKAMAVEADYYVAAGDLATWQRGLDLCGKILASRPGKVWVLPGNHETEAEVARFCETFGLNAFHGRSFEAAGRHIAGLGYSSPTPFDTPGEYSEREMARHLAPFAKLKPLVLVCHAPPHGTALDRIRAGLHAGSTAVREFIDRHQPEHFLCGHIHEAAGVTEMLGKTRAANAGKQGYLLELK